MAFCMNGWTWRPGHHRAAAGGCLRGHDEGARDDHRRPPEHSEQRGVPHNRHLSGIYWPGRPMRRERVESDQTYLHTVCDKFGKQLLYLFFANLEIHSTNIHDFSHYLKIVATFRQYVIHILHNMGTFAELSIKSSNFLEK